MELGEFDVNFHPRTSIKSQPFVDFVAELTQPLEMSKVDKAKCEFWELRVNGSSNQSGARVRIVLKSPYGEIFEQSLKVNFKASNNEVEYEALIISLKTSLAIGISRIKVLTDSQLVVQQLNGGYEAQDERLVQYATMYRDLMAKFESFEIVQVPSEDNSHADTLVTIGSTSGVIMKKVIPFSFQEEPSIEALKPVKVINVELSEDWCKEIIDYLERSMLPDNRVEAWKIKLRVARYVMLLRELYRRLFFGPYQKCLS